MRARSRGASAVLAVALLALAGCSSSSSDTSSGSSTPTDSSAAKALATAYKGDTGTVPTTPTKPKSGITLWAISCGQQVPSCSTPTAGVVEAAKKIGWTVKTCDGQLNPAGWGNCIRQATSAKADVMVPIGLDCASVQAPMEEANKAGVKIIGGGGADCNATGGKKTMTTERLQLKGVSIKQYWELNGKLQADWLIGKTNGKATVLMLNFTDPLWGPWLSEGFTKELATCSGCKVVKTLDIANADVAGGTMASKFSSALLQADVNSVMVPIGAWMGAGLSQAIQSSGKASKLYVATGFGDASTMDLIRTASFTMGSLGYATEWGSYGSVDEAIRVLNGQAPVVEGDGFQMVDKTKNLPAKGDYTGNVDFKAEYLKLWGVA